MKNKLVVKHYTQSMLETLRTFPHHSRPKKIVQRSTARGGGFWQTRNFPFGSTIPSQLSRLIVGRVQPFPAAALVPPPSSLTAV